LGEAEAGASNQLRRRPATVERRLAEVAAPQQRTLKLASPNSRRARFLRPRLTSSPPTTIRRTPKSAGPRPAPRPFSTSSPRCDGHVISTLARDRLPATRRGPVSSEIAASAMNARSSSAEK
jgi:hypothetical protein